MFELKESDLPELERLAAGGYKWIAKDWNEQVYAYTIKPFKHTTTWVGGLECKKIIGLGINSQICVHWSDPEPLNIAAAIAQIKAQSHAKVHGTPSGCDFCMPGDDIESVAVYGVRVGETVNETYTTRGMVQKMAKFCPMCGTPLTSPCEGGEKG